jgi:hypothetical protein
MSEILVLTIRMILAEIKDTFKMIIQRKKMKFKYIIIQRSTLSEQLFLLFIIICISDVTNSFDYLLLIRTKSNYFMVKNLTLGI